MKHKEQVSKKKELTFKRCKLVVGGSAIALKILADDPRFEAILCSTCNLSIHGFDSVKLNQSSSSFNHLNPKPKQEKLYLTFEKCTRSNEVKPKNQKNNIYFKKKKKKEKE